MCGMILADRYVPQFKRNVIIAAHLCALIIAICTCGAIFAARKGN